MFLIKEGRDILKNIQRDESREKKCGCYDINIHRIDLFLDLT